LRRLEMIFFELIGACFLASLIPIIFWIGLYALIWSWTDSDIATIFILISFWEIGLIIVILGHPIIGLATPWIIGLTVYIFGSIFEKVKKDG
jgi:hypothetical protein